MLRRRAALIGGVVLWCAVTASAPAAAPVFTAWSTPVWLGPVVNSASTEQGPALSSDGLSLYFYSGRSGGVGSDDIWVLDEHRSTTRGVLRWISERRSTHVRDYVPDLLT